MSKEKQVTYIVALFTAVFLLILAGVWVTGWFLSAKLIISGIGVGVYGCATGAVIEEMNKGE